MSIQRNKCLLAVIVLACITSTAMADSRASNRRQRRRRTTHRRGVGAAGASRQGVGLAAKGRRTTTLDAVESIEDNRHSWQQLPPEQKERDLSFLQRFKDVRVQTGQLPRPSGTNNNYGYNYNPNQNYSNNVNRNQSVNRNQNVNGQQARPGQWQRQWYSQNTYQPQQRQYWMAHYNQRQRQRTGPAPTPIPLNLADFTAERVSVKTPVKVKHVCQDPSCRFTRPQIVGEHPGLHPRYYVYSHFPVSLPTYAPTSAPPVITASTTNNLREATSVPTIPPTLAPTTTTARISSINDRQQLGGFNPPDKVVEVTSAPTAAPSPRPQPTDQPTLPPVNIPVFQAQVKSDTLSLVSTAGVDIRTEQDLFFKVTRAHMTPYLAEELQGLLTLYRLTLTFTDRVSEIPAVEPRNAEGNTSEGSATFQNIFEVTLTLDLESTDNQDVEVFTVEEANLILNRFYTEGTLERLLKGFNDQSLPIFDINVYTEEAETEEETRPPMVAPVKPEARIDDGGGDEFPHTRVYIALAILFLVFWITMTVLVVKWRNKKKRFYYYNEGRNGNNPNQRQSSSSSSGGSISGSNGGSISDSIYSSSRDSRRSSNNGSRSSSGIQPAALHVRNKKSRDLLQQSDSSQSNDEENTSLFQTPSYGYEYTTEVHGLLSGSIMEEDENEDESESKGEGANESEVFHDEDEIPRNDTLDSNDPAVIATSTLTCLDGNDESMSVLGKAYPEFEMFVNTPKYSPDWSLESADYGEGEEYAQQRRRWQDEANDLELIKLPEFKSTTDGITSGSGSGSGSD